MEEIYEHKGQDDDAKAFRDAADKTRFILQATGDDVHVEDIEKS